MAGRTGCGKSAAGRSGRAPTRSRSSKWVRAVDLAWSGGWHRGRRLAIDARDLFLAVHGRLHTESVGGRPSWQDGVCEGLTEAEIRARPGGSNSIAWLLWHITRIEDLIVNVALRDQAQVIEEPHWLAELGVDRAAIGTGMSDDEVADWSARLDLVALRGYRAEVGRRTRSWVSDGGLERLEPDVPVRERLSAVNGTFDEGSIELIDFWSTIGAHILVATPVLAHQALHLGEARVVRSHVLDLRRGGA